MTDYIETYRKIPVDKIVEFDETPGFGPWKDLFSPESTKHPAKANLRMLSFLIERYTSPGDVILDPMSGTGSTGTMANLHGRNAILVEYEEKFANMCKDNMKIVKKKPGLHKGSTLVLQGDARELSSILKEKVDFAMFSPPFAEQRHYFGKKSEEFYKQLAEKTKRKAWTDPESQTRKTIEAHNKGYSSDPDNIGNKPYGDVSIVLTSPPHGNINVTKSTCLKSDKCPKKLPAKDIDRDGYSKDGENIGNKEYGDIGAIITSPPHGGAVSTPGDPKRRAERMKKAGLDPKTIVGGKARCGEVDWQYSDDQENLGNLPYGKVDQVITSPPYSKANKGGGIAVKANKGGGIAVKGYEGKHGKDDKLQDRHERKLTEDDGNISNLPHGDIAIITSPPYEQSRPWKAKDYKKFVEVMRKRVKEGKVKGHYSTPEAELRHVRKMQEGSQMTEGNIGSEKGTTYLHAMLSVYTESYSVLKPGGLMIIIVKNFVRNWKPVRLDIDTTKLCQHIGFTLADHLYRRLKQKSFWIRQYEGKFRKKFPDPKVPLPTAQFEDILIFRKPVAS